MGVATGGGGAAQPVRRPVVRRARTAHRVQPGRFGERILPRYRVLAFDQQNRGRPVATSGIVQPPGARVAPRWRVLDHRAGRGAFAWRDLPALQGAERLHRSTAGRAREPDWPFSSIPGNPAWTTVRPGTTPWPQCRPTCRCSSGTPGATSPTRGRASGPTDEDYARYIRLALAYRDTGYDDAWALRGRVRGPRSGLQHLVGRIRARPGRDRQPTPTRSRPPYRPRRPDHPAYKTSYGPRRRAGPGIRHAERELQHEAAVGGALPLLLPDLDRDRVERIVAALAGPAFQMGSPQTFGVPSYDRTSAKYDPAATGAAPAG